MREFFWKIFQEISLSDANTADLKTFENLENLLPIFLTEKKFRVLKFSVFQKKHCQKW